MKKNVLLKKSIATLMAATMVASMAGCGNNASEESASNNATENVTENNENVAAESSDENNDSASAETTTLKILHFGAEPEGWAAVYEKFQEQTKDTLNVELDINWVEPSDYADKLNLEITAGGDWDLVFDAPWMHLKNLSAEGYYADLSEYFNNPDEYPGLASAFSADAMEANSWFGNMCYIPLFETYGNGIPCVYYRQDWAKEWGIGTDGQINSYEELEQYWQAAQDNGVTPYGATQSRGFYQMYTTAGYPEGAAEAGLELYSAGGLSIWTYVKDGELVSYAAEGSGDEAFADFPEGFNYDFGVERFEKFAEWQSKGYIDMDSLSCVDSETPFQSSLSASIVGTLDDYVKMSAYESDWGSEDALGFFVYVDGIRNMEAGAIQTNRSANNGLAVPSSSTKIDKTMEFLDWLFGAQENHDLFQLGIEGTDFVYGETDGTYETLTSYSADFAGYAFTWNPNYALISTAYTGKALDYVKYGNEDSTFMSLPVLGFRFDTSDVDLSTSVAQCAAVTDMTATVKLHGICTDGNGNSYDTITEMIQANTQEALENGGQEVLDAFGEQLRAYLAE